MSQILKHIIKIRKLLKDVSIEPFGFKGVYVPKTPEDAELLRELKHHLRDYYYKETNNDVDLTNIELNSAIVISIDLKENIAFYETIDAFIQSNKHELKDSSFYINENDYCSENLKSPFLENYTTNILLIDFLKNISDYSKLINGELELFFYKSEQGVAIEIEYNHSDLSKDISDFKRSIIELTEHFNQPSDSNERKQIFVNELITILNQKGCTYSSLLDNWNLLIDNYKKSFSLYLSGFSFEKVKTASIEYFHDLTDRIHSTVVKFSSYIFGIPIAYIFLIRFLDFSGNNIEKDTFLLLLGIIFFILIWFVVLKSVKDAILAIDKDISSFKSKITGDDNLVPIWNELDEKSKTIIPRQKRKLKLVKGLTIIIVVLLLFAYLKIHFDVLLKPLISTKKINKELFINSDSLANKTSEFPKQIIQDSTKDTIQDWIEKEKELLETNDSTLSNE